MSTHAWIVAAAVAGVCIGWVLTEIASLMDIGED